ncbi:MAG: hypothetical protein C0444_05585 [Microbacterium sp.]|nr:hypothetical protein [Microbacterium sp.]MBA4345545.1 hypothetical protein [Microbacterium sp.]
MAPLIGAVAIGVITGSPFVLVFALLSPIIAIASTLDGRRVARRERRAEAERFDRECLAFDRAIAIAHGRERAEAHARHPTSLAIEAASGEPVRVGTAPARSSVSPDEVLVSTDSADDRRLRALLDRARFNPAMPVLVPRGRFVVHGEGVIADALERRLSLEPHVRVTRGANEQHHANDDTVIRVVSATRIEVRVAGAPPVSVRPEFASRCDVAVARESRQAATPAALPTLVPWRTTQPVTTAEPSERAEPATITRGVPLGHDGQAVVRLDLESDGPHAIVGGTTGSGKSELLRTLALGWAAHRSPAEVHLLFIDFKGGATFSGLVDLPHAVGLVTDLDPVVAERALLSLRAELRRRERALVEAGVRDLSHKPGLFARLVVLVDEFAALIESFPDLHSVFADISARGRSLGVHLVLCTQHPAAAIRDAVATNCATRIAFRMSDSAGAAFIGAPGRELSGAPPGRAVVVTADASHVIQVATIDDADVAAVRERWSAVSPGRGPWLPPLPLSLDRSSLVTAQTAREPTVAAEGAPTPPAAGLESLAFGLLDDPAEQRQVPALWNPQRDGSLAVLGAPRSGRSTALAALATAAQLAGAPVVSMPHSAVEAWAVLERLTDQPLTRGLLVADDLDHVLASCEELATEFLARWDAAARAIRREGGGVAASIGSISTSRSLLSGRFDSRLILRSLDSDDHHLAGAPRGLFNRAAPAGRGRWADREVQVVRDSLAVLEPLPSDPLTWNVPADLDVIVVTRRVDAVADSLRRAHPDRAIVRDLAAEQSFVSSSPPAVTGGPRVFIADPEGWQSAWSLFTTLRRTAPIVITRADAADVRSLLGARVVPPPIDRHAADVWVVEPGRTVCRRQSTVLAPG